jgi:hypothetical protein
LPRPAGTAHEIPCPPVLVHPPGNVPMINPAGIVSVNVPASVTA